MATNTTPPSISLNAGYAGHYKGSLYTRVLGVWNPVVTPTGNWQLGGVDIPGETGATYLATADITSALTWKETTDGVTFASSNSLIRPALTNLVVDTAFRTRDNTRPIPTYTPSNPFSTSVIDPLYNSRITRISGDHGAQILNLAGGDTWGYQIRARYSTHNAWNCDESKMYFDTNDGGTGKMLFFHGQTYVPLAISRSQPAFMYECRWSHTEPNIMWFVTRDTSPTPDNTIAAFKRLDVTTGTVTTFHDFNGSYHHLAIGEGEGEPSRDDDKWAFMCQRSSDSHRAIIIFSTVGNAIIQEIDIEAYFDGTRIVDACTLDIAGQQLILYITPTGAGPETQAIYAESGGVWTFRRNINDTQKPSHYGTTIDAAGNHVLFGSDRSATPPGGGHVIFNRISDGTITTMVPTGFIYHSGTQHYAGPYADKWHNSDTWTDSGGDGSPYVDQILVVAQTPGAGSVGRIGNIMSSTSNGSLGYKYEHQTSSSPTGKRLVTHTTWMQSAGGSSTTQLMVLVYDWRHMRFPVVETGPTAININITCTSTSTRTKNVRKPIPITCTSTVAMVKAIVRKFSLICTNTFTLFKSVGKKISATATSSIQSMTPVATHPGFSQAVNITCTTSMAFSPKSVLKKTNITCTSTVAAVKKAISRLVALTASSFVVNTAQGSLQPKQFSLDINLNCASNTSTSNGGLGKHVDIPCNGYVDVEKDLTRSVGLSCSSAVHIHFSTFITNLKISVRVIKALERYRTI